MHNPIARYKTDIEIRNMSAVILLIVDSPFFEGAVQRYTARLR